MVDDKYRKILVYINYFEDENIDFFTWQQPSKTDDGIIQMGYPIYDEKFKIFIKDVYDSNLLIDSYFDYLEQHQIDTSKLTGYISNADFQLLRAILTYTVRGERFCDGYWGQAIKDKVFLNILYRIRILSS